MLLQNERFLLISSVKSLCPNITKLSSLQMRNISLFRQDLFFIFSIMKLQMVSNSIFVVLMPLYSWRSQRQKSDFMGNRNLLPQKHYLRFLGQSGKCCPPNFYEGNKWFEFEHFEDPTFAVAKVEKRKRGSGVIVEKGMKSKRSNTINPLCSSCQPNSENVLNENIEFIFLLRDEAFVWFHSKDFISNIYTSTFGQYLH